MPIFGERTLGLALLAALSLPSIASAQTADTVLFNGKILTVDKDFSVRQALAIAHGQVLASGTSAVWAWEGRLKARARAEIAMCNELGRFMRYLR